MVINILILAAFIVVWLLLHSLHVRINKLGKATELIYKFLDESMKSVEKQIKNG